MQGDGVAEEARWMSYDELADARGISRQSARHLVRRHRWLRRQGNDGEIKALVPFSEIQVQPRPAADTAAEPRGDIAAAITAGIDAAIPGAIAAASEPLKEQLAHERKRADEAAIRADDAVAAERIATQRAVALQATLDLQEEWGLLRRLLWAIRRR
jgi:hypothetical protein